MHDAIRDLMSGRSRGPLPAAARAGLSVAEVGYGLAMSRRNLRFDRGRGVCAAGVPVVSVGNLTAGGTGKTPVVAMLANRLRAAGRNVVLLSRGYRALKDDAATNDEARVLELLCPGVPHLQRPDRVASAADAVTRLGADVLVLDDGFQHRRLGRDLDVVLIDATNPFGYGRLLPRGLLREPVASLRRADLVFVTRADLVDEAARSAIAATVRRVRADLPVCEVAFPATGAVNSDGTRTTLADLAGLRTLAFCGIGNPSAFRATLAAAGIEPAGFVAFPDHHHYDAADLSRLSDAVAACGAAAAVTTLKDLVKIPSAALPGRSGVPESSGVPLWAVEIGVEVRSGGESLDARLATVLGRAA